MRAAGLEAVPAAKAVAEMAVAMMVVAAKVEAAMEAAAPVGALVAQRAALG